MQIEKWKNLIGNIKDKFEVEDEGQEHIDDEGGIDIEYIVFTSPMGAVRLEHVSRPVVLDKKTNYSKRIGSETDVKYVYSETERTYVMTAYKWDEAQDDWVEIDSGVFA